MKFGFDGPQKLYTAIGPNGSARMFLPEKWDVEKLFAYFNEKFDGPFNCII